MAIGHQLVDTLRPGDTAELAPAAHPRVFGSVVEVKTTAVGTEVVWKMDGRLVLSVFSPNAAVKVKFNARKKRQVRA